MIAVGDQLHVVGVGFMCVSRVYRDGTFVLTSATASRRVRRVSDSVLFDVYFKRHYYLKGEPVAWDVDWTLVQNEEEEEDDYVRV